MLPNVGVAALHLLALGIGLGAVWARGSALAGGAPDENAVARALAADNAWGVAALLWLATGLPRLLTSLEKGTAYYMHNDFFLAKMAIFGVLMVAELWPMVTLIRWRIARSRGRAVDTSPAGKIAWISRLEAMGLVAMVFCAAAMARGLGQAP